MRTYHYEDWLCIACVVVHISSPLGNSQRARPQALYTFILRLGNISALYTPTILFIFLQLSFEFELHVALNFILTHIPDTDYQIRYFTFVG